MKIHCWIKEHFLHQTPFNCLALTLDAGGGVEGHKVRRALAHTILAQDAPAHLVGAVFVVVAARAQLVAAARAKYGRRNQPHLH